MRYNRVRHRFERWTATVAGATPDLPNHKNTTSPETNCRSQELQSVPTVRSSTDLETDRWHVLTIRSAMLSPQTVCRGRQAHNIARRTTMPRICPRCNTRVPSMAPYWNMIGTRWYCSSCLDDLETAFLNRPLHADHTSVCPNCKGDSHDALRCTCCDEPMVGSLSEAVAACRHTIHNPLLRGYYWNVDASLMQKVVRAPRDNETPLLLFGGRIDSKQDLLLLTSEGIHYRIASPYSPLWYQDFLPWTAIHSVSIWQHRLYLNGHLAARGYPPHSPSTLNGGLR